MTGGGVEVAIAGGGVASRVGVSVGIGAVGGSGARLTVATKVATWVGAGDGCEPITHPAKSKVRNALAMGPNRIDCFLATLKRTSTSRFTDTRQHPLVVPFL